MGTTISHVVISYDVDGLHNQVKSSMENLGYKTNFSFQEVLKFINYQIHLYGPDQNLPTRQWMI